MADDKLIYPLGFDLQAAVDDAGEDWDKKYAKKLEDLIAKRPVNVKLTFDTSKLDSLDDVKKRLAQLKIEPLTPENQRAIKDLVKELKELARIMERVQKFKGIELPELQMAKAAKLRKDVEQANEKLRLSQERVRQAEERLILSQKRAEQQAHKTGKAYQSQEGYISRLIKRLAVYAGFQQISNFLTSVREVTAEFELQRVSLGAIIQDQQRANALFSEIKSFALKSPVSILALTKYTKQLAAYKFQTEELFDWTKRLTDISVGLGVSMDRIVLLAGQIRATGFLRGSEIRQATEAGIPLVEALADKLSKMNGELVTAGQVMEMVSKRAISWEMVSDIFKDMTSAGGMFYNMQEKQGNTLFGLWAKLGDAASVMYDEIGNTEDVNSAMKTTIGLLTELMRNWKAVANTAAWVVAPSVATGMFTKYALSSTRKQAADAAATAAIKAREAAELRLTEATKNGSVADINAANATLQKAKADEVAAQKATTKTGLMASGFKSIASSLAMGLGVGAVITAVTALSYKLFEAYENATRLKNNLKEIDAERILNTERSVRNFEFLADAALDTSKSVKEQKDKLDELHRTFKEMIPVEDMSIENLRRLRDGADNASEAYRSLTDSVREYIAEQSKQKALGAIEQEFGAKRITAMKNLYDWFDKQGLSVEERTRFFAEFEKQATDTSKTLKEQIVAAFNEAGIEGSEQLANSIAKEKGFWNRTLDWIGKNQPLMFGATSVAYNAIFPDDGYINDLATATRKYNEEVSGTLSYYESLEGNLGKYTKAMESAKKHMAEFIPAGLDSNTFAYQTAVNEEQIRTWGKVIVDALKEENIRIENEWFNIDKDKALSLSEITTINIEKIKKSLGSGHGDIKKLLDRIANEYNNLVPSDRTVQVLRAKLIKISQSTGVSMDKLKNHWMNAGESIEDYAKRIKDAIEDMQKKIKEMNQINADKEAMKPGSFLLKGYSEEEIKQANAMLLALQQMFSGLSGFTKGGNSGRTSDPRLNNLKEEISLTKKLYDEYKKLEKQIGATRAAEKIQEIYSNTIKTLQGRAGKYGFTFELPFTDENLKANMQQFINKMKELQKLTDKKGKPLFPNIGKDIDEAVAQLEDVGFNYLQKALEKKLKDLSDRISRTKTAKEFYDKILSQTGDVDLATNVTMSVYGDTGEGLFDNLVEQIRQSFTSGDVGIDLQITADIDAAIDTTNQRINYQKLAEVYEKYQNDIIEKNRDTAQKIVSEGQKTAAANILTWEKELAKAKDYEQQRTDIINRETQRRAEIIKSNLPQEEKDRLTAQSRKKQEEDVATVNFEEFTKGEDYIKIFENLDNTSAAALKRLREEMRKLIETNKDLSPENMKTLVKAMEDIDEQISGRGFGNDMVQSVSDYIDALRDLKTARAELQTAQAEYDAQLPQLDADVETAKAKEIAAQKELNALKAQELQDENAIVAAALRLNNATTAVTNAEQAKARAADKVKKAETKVTEQQDKQKKATNKFFKDLQNVASEADQLANVLGDVKDLLGISKDSAAGIAFDAAIGSLQTMSKAISAVTAAQALFNIIAESNPYIAIAAGVMAVGMAIGSWISGNKVRKANKEIARQAELIEQLEYAYERLQKAADRLFGSDYINNFNQQQAILQARAEAYRKQAEAERSKGKKADEDKIKEYENAYRDTMDEIADMEGELTAKLTGTARQDAAKQFVQSWFEAKAQFANTKDAILSDYKDLVKNMIMEGAAARLIDNILTPMWEEMDGMLTQGDITGAIDHLVSGMDSFAQQADDTLNVLWQSLKAHGYDMQKIFGDTDSGLTGIAKNVASASSEEINANTAALNVQNYYASHLPAIAMNVEAIRASMEKSMTSSLATANAGWTDWQTQAMEHYVAIHKNTADTVAACYKIAEKCTAIAEDVHRVVKPRGSSSTYGIQVWT